MFAIISRPDRLDSTQLASNLKSNKNKNRTIGLYLSFSQSEYNWTSQSRYKFEKLAEIEIKKDGVGGDFFFNKEIGIIKKTISKLDIKFSSVLRSFFFHILSTPLNVCLYIYIFICVEFQLTCRVTC